MDANVKPVETAFMPVLPEVARRMVNAIDRNASYFSLYQIFLEMVEIQIGRCGPNDGAHRVALEQIHRYEKDFIIILHCISRPVLRSLVMGRLGHDLWNPDSERWKNVYSRRGGGTYALAMYIDGRRGNWLTRNEIDDLDKLLEDYSNACVLWHNQTHVDSSYGTLTTEQQSFMQRAMEIDNALLKSNDKVWKLSSSNQWVDDGSSVAASEVDIDGSHISHYNAPRFMSTRSADKSANITQLREMIARRSPSGRGFDRNVQQEAVPVQVGCSDKMEQRMNVHNPDISHLGGSSNAWGLLLSCIKFKGLRPRLVGVPIVQVWEPEHVGFSETLVHVLAGSFLNDRGLNVKAPGKPARENRDEMHVSQDARIDVWVNKPWFKENLRQSLGIMDEKKVQDLQTRVDQVAANAAILEDLTKQVKRLQERVASKRREEIPRALAEANAKTDEWEKFRDEFAEFELLYFGESTMNE